MSNAAAILVFENRCLAAVMNPIAPQKDEVREFWNADPCGTRYLEGKDDFDAHARARYALEPYIFDFAQFQSCARVESAWKSAWAWGRTTWNG